MLKLTAAEPAWLDILPGVSVQFAPIGIKAVRAARRAAAMPENDTDPGDVLSRELVRAGIVAWKGVGDADGKALLVTPESIDLFVRNPVTYEAAAVAYLSEWLAAETEKNIWRAEGNASASSLPGTGRAAREAKAASYQGVVDGREGCWLSRPPLPARRILGNGVSR